MSTINIFTSKQICDSPDLYKRLFYRSSTDYNQVISQIKPKLQAVQQYGDTAILEKYRKRNIPINDLRVSQAEIEEAFGQVSSAYMDALQTAKTNLECVCQEQMHSLRSQNKTIMQNKQVKIWRRWLPVGRVGVYAPGGNANYPSSVLMAIVPAQIAGVSNVVLTVPPKSTGCLPAEVIVTAITLGITNIWKVGGAQAIAALAYGTQSIPKVDLVVGPGNQYVTAAKIALFPQISIDMPAGPSENIIIADDSADPSFIAADLITDCEHGNDSTGLLFTSSRKLASAVAREISAQVEQLSSKAVIEKSLKQYGAIILTATLNETIDLVNAYAPEHLQIFTTKPLRVAKKMVNAGSIFIGQYSAKALGDYCTGANHILPTGRSARQYGPLSVESFGRWQELQKVNQSGFMRLAQTAITFAQVEELPAHANSITRRLNTTRN